MLSGEENKLKATEYFNLSKQDRMEIELENREKKEQDLVVEEVFSKLNEKYKKHNDKKIDV